MPNWYTYRGNVRKYLKRSRVSIAIAAILALLLLGSQVLLPTVTAAKAEVYTCGTNSHYFDGKYEPVGQGNYVGSAAMISTRYGAVCDTKTGQGNYVAVWAMIASYDGNGWAQSGYVRWYNNCTVLLAQIMQTRGVTNPQTFYGTTCMSTDGSTNTFKEYYQNSNHSCFCVQAMVGTRALLTSTFDPASYWTPPWGPEFAGEAAYLASDMPGNSSAPTSFTNLQFEQPGGTFTDYGCGELFVQNDGKAERSDGEAWYNVTKTCPSFDIYTDTAGN
jgi:hypothetical protein